MTLPLNSRLSALYDTNGSQKDFSFGFRVFFDPDNGGYGLEVRRQTEDGYEVIPKSDYLVLPVEDNSAGIVRFSVAPSAGQQIYIAGKTPTIQQLVLTNFGRYSAESIETQFDFITAIIQEWLSALDEETRRRIAGDQITRDYVDAAFQDWKEWAEANVPEFAEAYLNSQFQELQQNWIEAINQITAGEVPALSVPTSNGKNQQQINDSVGADWYPKSGGYSTGDRVRLLDGEIYYSIISNNTNNPNENKTGWINNKVDSRYPDFYKRPSDPNDDLSFQRLAARNPKEIILDGSKTYEVTQTHVLNEGCIVQGNGATIRGTALGIRPKQMEGSKFNAAFAKGVKVIPVVNASMFSVGERVFIWLIPSISPHTSSDEYMQEVQYNTNITWRTTQSSVITAVDTVANTVTIQEGTISNSTNLGYVYKINSKQYKFFDINWEFTNTDAAGYAIDYVCNFHSRGLRFNHADKGQNDPLTSFITTFMISTCYNSHHVNMFGGEGIKVGFYYGARDGSVSFSEFVSRVHSDGVLTTYAGTDNFLSYRNTFKFSELYRGPVIQTDGAGLYFGAKSRNCVSLLDHFDGFFIPIRVMFGTEKCVIDGAVTINSRQQSMTISVAHDLTIRNCNFDRHIYALHPDKLKLLNNPKIGSSWVDGAAATSAALTIAPNPNNDPLDDVRIEGNEFIGMVVINIGLIDPKILGNSAAAFTLYPTSAASMNIKGEFSGNTGGGLTLRNVLGMSVHDNILDDFHLRGLTSKRESTITFSGHVACEIYDNHIVGELVGIKNQTNSSAFSNAIIERGNRIHAPTRLQLGVSASVAPSLLAAHKAHFPVDSIARSSDGKGYKLKDYTGASPVWVKVDSKENETYSYNLSFPPIANGVFTTTRTISGVEIGDQVAITAPTINPATGEFTAKVTASNTVTIYYKNFTASVDSISASVHLTVIN